MQEALYYAALPNTDSNSEKLTSPVSPRSNELNSIALWSYIEAKDVRAVSPLRSQSNADKITNTYKSLSEKDMPRFFIKLCISVASNVPDLSTSTSSKASLS